MNKEIIDFFQKEKDEKINRFRILNSFCKKGATVFAGSSLMEQFPIYEFMINENLNMNLYNRGVGGFTLRELDENIDICILDLEPSRLFLNIGTNDLNEAGFEPSSFLSRYQLLINKLKSHLPSTEIILMAFYPGNPNCGKEIWQKMIFEFRTNERIESINLDLERLALDNNLLFINLNKELYDENKNLNKDYTIDGIHMYANGYMKVFDELKKYL